MGKAARWFRSILGKKDLIAKDHHPEQKQQQDQHQHQQPVLRTTRWSFGRSSSRDSAEAAAIGRTAWIRSAAAPYAETEREREQSRHAVAVAVATAAAAARAAVAVVRLTSNVRAAPVVGGRAAAAVRIQTAFRGFLAKKALRALKALVKLQALVRGYLVRRQAAATLKSMQALIRAQAAVRARRSGDLPLLHHPPVRPRYSLSLHERYYVDDTRSEHGAAAAAYSSRRLSASIESSSCGFDRSSPRIVEVDPGRPKSRSSSRWASTTLLEEWSAGNSASSPLSCYLATGPPRIAVPTCHQFPDHDLCALEKVRPATAQSTPRYSCAPPTPTKSVSGCSPSLSCRSYMSGTQSSEAKARSHSAPKQRPELDVGARKRVPLSELVALESSRTGVTTHRSSCTGRAAQETVVSFKTPGVSRKDRMHVGGHRRERPAGVLAV